MNLSAPLILLVSPDPAVEAAVRTAVNATGHQLRQLGSDYGAMAVIHAGVHEAALALVDLAPGLHGLELCRAAARHMPVFALTGDDNDGMEEKAREHGACGCLSKPLEAERVGLLIKQTRGVQAPSEL